MTRDLTPEVVAQLEKNFHPSFRLFYADFPEPWRTWTGYGTLPWDGHEWLGLADLLGVSESKETIDTGSEALEVVLSGVDPAKLSLVLGQDLQGRDVEIWYGFLDENGQVIPDPYLEYAGTLDQLAPLDEEGSAVIRATIETAWANTRPTNLRYTDAAQKALYAGDRFFEYAARHSASPTEWLIK